jgi:hypothetical protein
MNNAISCEDVHKPTKTSIAAEARRPAKLMSRILRSARRNTMILSSPARFNTSLNGSATQTKTNRNSKGACSQEAARRRFNTAGPRASRTSIRVAPRLKKPIRPPVSDEKPASRRFLVEPGIGGVHRTFAIMKGYRKESKTGMQLFAKTSRKTVTPPRAIAPRTGATARAFSRKSIPSRKVTENAISSAPTTEPNTKDATVAPNAKSTNFIASTLSGVGFMLRGGFGRVGV